MGSATVGATAFMIKLAAPASPMACPSLWAGASSHTMATPAVMTPAVARPCMVRRNNMAGPTPESSANANELVGPKDLRQAQGARQAAPIHRATQPRHDEDAREPEDAHHGANSSWRRCVVHRQMLGQKVEAGNRKSKRHVGRQQANERPRNPARRRGSGRCLLAQERARRLSAQLGCWRPALPVVDDFFFVSRVHCLLLVGQTGASKTGLPSPFGGGGWDGSAQRPLTLPTTALLRERRATNSA